MANSAQQKNKQAPIWIPIIVTLGVALVIWLIIGSGTSPSTQGLNNSRATNSSASTNSAGQIGSTNFSLVGDVLTDRGYVPDTTITVQELPQTESSCSGQAGNWVWDEEYCLPADQETCEEFGARWEQLQANADHTCVVRTSDGNADCISSSQCEGRCFAPTTTISKSTTPDDEVANVTGSCGYFIPTLGCFPEVNKGVVGVVCL